MFHVIHVICSTGYYGAERMVVELTSGLKSRGWRAMIVNLGDRGEDLLEAARRANIPAVALACRGRFDPRAVRFLRRLAIEERVSLMHSHGYKADTFAYVSRPAGCGLVATCHNWPDSSVMLKVYGWLDRFVLKRFDRVAAVSEDVDELLRQARIRREKITFIPNGITPGAVTSVDPSAPDRVRDELSIRKDQRVALAVGRLSSEKGFEGLIDAWQDIRSAAGPVKLVIAGGGPLQARLEQMVAEQGLDGAVVVAGVRRDIPALLAVSDLFIMPSLTEGIPLALLEAMASRTPVVAARAGGIPYVTGNDAILVDPGSRAALTAGIIHALTHQERSRTMASRAEKRIAERFTSSIMTGKYVSLYDEVLTASGIDIEASIHPSAAETVR